MKRITALIAALLLLASTAVAEIDLSGMTLEEMIELHEQIQLALFEQAKSVVVPQGIWLVGKDIPAGTYLIRCADLSRSESSMRFCTFKWGTTKPDDLGFFEGKTQIGLVSLYNPNNSHYIEGQTSELVVELEDGMYVYIGKINNRVEFFQYTGTPSFSFDW